MAVLVTNRKGNQVTLLNPSEKGKKFATELKMGVRFTNDGIVKVNDFGEPLQLDDKSRAYRSGYLASRQDDAKCYNFKKKKGSYLPTTTKKK